VFGVVAGVSATGPAWGVSQPVSSAVPDSTLLFGPPSGPVTPAPSALEIPGSELRFGPPLPNAAELYGPPDSSVPEPYEDLTGFWAGWVGRLELGGGGLEGNTRRANARIGVSLSRETEAMSTFFGADYRIAREQDQESENRFRLNADHEWRLPPARRLRPFIEGEFESNRFQDWDQRVVVFGGLGFAIFDGSEPSEEGRIPSDLVFRAGYGGAREYGSNRNDFQEEALVSLAGTVRFTERRLVRLNAEYIPDLIDDGEFRVNARAEYEIVLDPDNDIRLILGAEDRYDSDPGEARRNEFEYFITLSVGF
jgi:hypothetical protein